MSRLTRLAFETLEDPASPFGLRSTACSTLMHAIDLRVQVPHGSPMACWRFLVESESSGNSLNQHHLQDPEVARDAVRAELNWYASTWDKQGQRCFFSVGWGTAMLPRRAPDPTCQHRPSTLSSKLYRDSGWLSSGARLALVSRNPPARSSTSKRCGIRASSG